MAGKDKISLQPIGIIKTFDSRWGYGNSFASDHIKLGFMPGPANSKSDLAPPDYCDPVIEAYKKDIDRSLLRENLKLTVEERFRKFESFARYARELREAGDRSRSEH